MVIYTKYECICMRGVYIYIDIYVYDFFSSSTREATATVEAVEGRNRRTLAHTTLHTPPTATSHNKDQQKQLQKQHI